MEIWDYEKEMKLRVVILDSAEEAEQVARATQRDSLGYGHFLRYETGDCFVIVARYACKDATEFCTVLLHELAHAFHAIYGFEDTEELAEDCAFDWAKQARISTRLIEERADLPHIVNNGQTV